MQIQTVLTKCVYACVTLYTSTCTVLTCIYNTTWIVQPIRNKFKIIIERCHARVKEYYTFCYYVTPNQRRRRKEQVTGICNR